MRPIRLEVQGLTSYKEPISIDFTELDLFAITGPTGSGKSSLVDAVTYALFGQMPRVGRNIKDLISQGSDRMSVTLEFSANGERYRIFRESSRRGQKPPQLERFHGDRGEFLPEDVDRVKDANAYIERLLSLNYDSFIRSVLLPQGEFQQFLAGDRNERREVLNRLLRLGVYHQMHQRANSMYSQERGEAERMRERLEKELSDATPEALAAAAAELAQMEQEVAELAGRRQALETAARAAEDFAAAVERAKKAEREAAAAITALKHARETLSGGEKTIADLDAQIAHVRAKSAESEYDADLLLQLRAAMTNAQERDAIQARLGTLGSDGERILDDLALIQAATADARTRVTDAHTTAQAASDVFEELRKVNATVVLRSGLKLGDPCPVCGQAIPFLPSEGDDADHVRKQLEHARTDLENARNEEKKAEKIAADVERDAAVLADRGTKLQHQLAEVKADLDRRTTALKVALGSASVTTDDVKQRIAALESAKQSAEALSLRERELAEQREKRSQDLLSAQASVAALDAQAESYKREREAAEKQAAESRSAVNLLAIEHAWEDTLETLEAGGDVVTIIRQELEHIRERETQVNQGIGGCRRHIEQIKGNIALAEELRGKQEQHMMQARIARDLATILQANALPAYIRESAMQALATGASAWLRNVSMGRYDLKVKGQDFGISDLWNAGEERPVQTLSGGETFLASLALALALAEQLPGMSSGAESAALESLFIDEGFSNLDEETLKVVRDALYVLGADRRRLIGVITHINALAEDLPARIVVHKDSTGGPSTLTVQ